LMLGQDIPKTFRAKAGNAMWNHYRCSDGRWLCFAMTQSETYWHDFCRAVGIVELEHDPRFQGPEERREHGEELVSILDRIFETRTRAEWTKILDETADFAYAPVNSTADLMTDTQAIANKYITEFDHPALGPIKVVGSPVVFSGAEVGPRLPAPELGEHTEEVLLEIGGYNWDDIVELKELEVI
ncbi:MAG: CoA transferase, partial [Dehalococcoidia bacterium]|nr:CoA transferase [Dehalococcoidia bacterium]